MTTRPNCTVNQDDCYTFSQIFIWKEHAPKMMEHAKNGGTINQLVISGVCNQARSTVIEYLNPNSNLFDKQFLKFFNGLKSISAAATDATHNDASKGDYNGCGSILASRWKKSVHSMTAPAAAATYNDKMHAYAVAYLNGDIDGEMFANITKSIGQLEVEKLLKEANEMISTNKGVK